MPFLPRSEGGTEEIYKESLETREVEGGEKEMRSKGCNGRGIIVKDNLGKINIFGPTCKGVKMEHGTWLCTNGNKKAEVILDNEESKVFEEDMPLNVKRQLDEGESVEVPITDVNELLGIIKMC